MTTPSETYALNGSLVVFSLGAKPRLADQIKALQMPVCTALWVDPFSKQDPLPGVGTATPLTHVEAVPATRDGEVDVIGYSLPGLFSLTPAKTSLTALFPGLAVQSKIPVATIKAQPLLRQISELPRPLSVLIDVPGAEKTILDLLNKGKILDGVSALHVRCGIEPFFNKARPAEEIKTFLEACGFELTLDNGEDPDWPVYQFRKEPMARKIAELEKKLSAEKGKLRSAKKALKESTQKHNDATAQLTHIQQKAAQLRSEASVAMRLHAASTSDLEDLRIKYHDVCQERDRQTQLLEQLLPRLQEASSQLKLVMDAPKVPLSSEEIESPASKASDNSGAETFQK